MKLSKVYRANGEEREREMGMFGKGQAELLMMG